MKVSVYGVFPDGTPRGEMRAIKRGIEESEAVELANAHRQATGMSAFIVKYTGEPTAPQKGECADVPGPGEV